MFLRSILYPSLVACVIGVPLLYNTGVDSTNKVPANYGYSLPIPSGPFQQVSSINSIPIRTQNAQIGDVNVVVPSNSAVSAPNPAASASLQVAQTVNSIPQPEVVAQAVGQVVDRLGAMQLPAGTTFPPGMVVSGPIARGVAPTGFGMTSDLTPDYGAAETLVFPGDAHGPDLTVEPTDFVPVTNLAEIIRFDVFPNWVKSRWNRVSTNPGDAGLHGLRVALVTGTNTWDLHGSLTYYFDVNQRAQRITFRGWTGDSSRFVNLLTSRYGLKAQPTHWAGAYMAQNKRGVPMAGLLMQHPAVITRENPVQQVALVMELNHPQGSFQLSEDFISMLHYAVESR